MLTADPVVKVSVKPLIVEGSKAVNVEKVLNPKLVKNAFDADPDLRIGKREVKAFGMRFTN